MNYFMIYNSIGVPSPILSSFNLWTFLRSKFLIFLTSCFVVLLLRYLGFFLSSWISVFLIFFSSCFPIFSAFSVSVLSVFALFSFCVLTHYPPRFYVSYFLPSYHSSFLLIYPLIILSFYLATFPLSDFHSILLSYVPKSFCPIILSSYVPIF